MAKFHREPHKENAPAPMMKVPERVVVEKNNTGHVIVTFCQDLSGGERYCFMLDPKTAKEFAGALSVASEFATRGGRGEATKALDS